VLTAGCPIDAAAHPADDPTAFGRRVVEAIEAPIKLPDGWRVTVGASIGIATGTPGDVIHMADNELYRTKQAKHRSLQMPR
jgi:predicted signal transduction protein with EAL and GGDEF domain